MARYLALSATFTALVLMLARFSKKKGAGVLPRGADKHWKGSMVAFLKKRCYAGPITIWYFDKSDKGAVKRKEYSHMESTPGGKAREIVVHDLDLDPDVGLNKGRTYIIHLGQLLGRRKVIFAKGEVTLKP
ncbi:MAG: hypothetical protein JRH20_22605 [Deltaproteobacteria bacterium]|nr:hypothetical protein [Deltaproteobacteria bacterium]